MSLVPRAEYQRIATERDDMRAERDRVKMAGEVLGVKYTAAVALLGQLLYLVDSKTPCDDETRRRIEEILR